MAVTMSELFGTKNVIEDCRQQTKMIGSNDRTRISAEILLKNGDRRIYRAKSLTQKNAKREVVSFVAAVERATGEKVIWRFKGEETYQFSTNFTSQPSLFQKAKKSLLDYFFPIED
ncbi:hypothetical protein AWM68_17310 [Fictibacillus phosphorivorans]|uniref:Uncharacterized protein n=1 Tax=Fictibacillus phosphorivorans TaxID=1221500 RepID=A0A163S127_9BACL|nr:DUF6018 family natural product bioysynthesis protein [Fictibacillus phosphorivorans]KZE67932.1 hypothetical protein AWM68_17310 [Fictibacillus phosphorivorans]